MLKLSGKLTLIFGAFILTSSMVFARQSNTTLSPKTQFNQIHSIADAEQGIRILLGADILIEQYAPDRVIVKMGKRWTVLEQFGPSVQVPAVSKVLISNGIVSDPVPHLEELIQKLKATGISDWDLGIKLSVLEKKIKELKKVNEDRSNLTKLKTAQKALQDAGGEADALKQVEKRISAASAPVWDVEQWKEFFKEQQDRPKFEILSDQQLEESVSLSVKKGKIASVKINMNFNDAPETVYKDFVIKAFPFLLNSISLDNLRGIFGILKTQSVKTAFPNNNIDLIKALVESTVRVTSDNPDRVIVKTGQGWTVLERNGPSVPVTVVSEVLLSNEIVSDPIPHLEELIQKLKATDISDWKLGIKLSLLNEKIQELKEVDEDRSKLTKLKSAQKALQDAGGQADALKQMEKRISAASTPVWDVDQWSGFFEKHGQSGAKFKILPKKEMVETVSVTREKGKIVAVTINAAFSKDPGAVLADFLSKTLPQEIPEMDLSKLLQVTGVLAKPIEKNTSKATMIAA